MAEVIPILKDSDHEEAANNRPLSPLAVASKVCEKIILNQFNAYFVANKCLTSHQTGNKKAHSTETLNIHLTDSVLALVSFAAVIRILITAAKETSVLEAMDKKQITALVLLDLTKAFDSNDHARLLRKLSTVGASPLTVNWFKSYISSRYQYVRIGSTYSDTLPITHGVPQGAILSPLLFCIYLNDLPLAPSSCNLESYIDDSKLFLFFPLSELDVAIGKLEQDLLSVAQWCCENQLLINPDKTKLLFLGTRQLLNKLPQNLSMSFLSTILNLPPTPRTWESFRSSLEF